jgi:hypothetical protein
MSSTSNEDTNIANTNTTRDNQSEQEQQQQEPTQQDSGQTTVAGQGYTVDSTIKHRRRRQQLDEQNNSPDPSLRGQQETDTSNTNTITTGADPAAVATGIPPKQQQRLEDNEQPENQE